MRKTRKADLARRQKSDEPFLFDYDSLPIREDVVECVRQERYKNTGARLLDNEELTQRVVTRLVLRHGIERIAREERISPMSIRAARDVLESQGKIGGYVKRSVQWIEDIVEAGLRAYYEGIISGAVSPGQLPVGLGILFDKRALALGEPTSIGVSAVNLRPEVLSERALNAWVDALPVEAESTVIAAEPKQIAPPAAADAAFGADAAPPTALGADAAPPTAPLSPDAPAQATAPPPAPPEMGGGGQTTGGA